MCNVCRPFVLYNDFLPPTQKVHDDWGSLVFGYYDGISVGEDLLTAKSCDLRFLWEYFVSQGKILNGSFSSQIVFGFRSEPGERSYDKEFWGDVPDGGEYPFIFVTLLQADVESEANGWKNRTKLEQQLSSPNERKAITYLTLDSSDIIVVLQCKSYADGAGVIDGFHQTGQASPLAKAGWSIKYSFTIAGIRKCVLNQEKASANLTEPIPHVSIYLIEKWPGGVKAVCNEIEEKYPKYVKEKHSVLGCNDEGIVLENIPWQDFLTLYQDETGILNHSSVGYGNNLTGVTTIIGEAQSRQTYSTEKKKDEGRGENALTLSGQLRKLCNKMEVLEERDTVRCVSMKKYLYQIINSLEKFEKTPFPDYVFLSAILPLDMVMQMSKEVKDEIQSNVFFRSFYEFMKGLNLYVQNSIRSDRQFTQAQDFNIKIYDTPVKLNVFYSAFIYYVTEYLNQIGETEQNQHEYEFLVCLGVTDNMQVQELFKALSDTRRLFLVSIPENQVYNPKLMLIMLSHEVGHFVGKTIRNRDCRYNCAIVLMAKAITKYLKKEIFDAFRDQGEELSYIQKDQYWKCLEQKLAALLQNYSDKNMDPQYIQQVKYDGISDEEAKNLSKLMEKYGTYSHMMKNLLMDSAEAVFRLHRNELFGYLLERDYLYWLGHEKELAVQKRTQFDVKIQEISDGLLSESPWAKKRICMSSVIDMFLDMFKECVADLIGIMILKLPMKDYLYAIQQSSEDQGVSVNKMAEEIIIRGGIVAYCMNYSKENYDPAYRWTDEDLEAITQETQAGIVELKDKIVKFVKTNYSDQSQRNDTGIVMKREVDIFMDPEILEVIAGYLLRCRQTFDKYNTEQMHPLQDRLMEVYRLFQDGDVEEMVLEMQNYIGKYQSEIREKVASTATKRWENMKCDESSQEYGRKSE